MELIIVVEVSEHVYIYLNPLGHTLKGVASIEYKFGKLIRERGHSKGVCGSLRMVPQYHR
jgi:hypothetical protein